MSKSDLKIRTKDYALSVIGLFAALPKRTETHVLGRQLLRAGTSVGAQYREATRAKSKADFISKIEGSLQELEETDYWLELSKYAQKARKDPVIVVKKGKPFAAVIPLRNADEETVSLSTNRKIPGNHRALAISYEKGRRVFVQRTPPPVWPKKIVISTFREFSKRGSMA